MKPKEDEDPVDVIINSVRKKHRITFDISEKFMELLCKAGTAHWEKINPREFYVSNFISMSDLIYYAFEYYIKKSKAVKPSEMTSEELGLLSGNKYMVRVVKDVKTMKDENPLQNEKKQEELEIKQLLKLVKQNKEFVKQLIEKEEK